MNLWTIESGFVVKIRYKTYIQSTYLVSFTCWPQISQIMQSAVNINCATLDRKKKKPTKSSKLEAIVGILRNELVFATKPNTISADDWRPFCWSNRIESNGNDVLVQKWGYQEVEISQTAFLSFCWIFGGDAVCVPWNYSSKLQNA